MYDMQYYLQKFQELIWFSTIINSVYSTTKEYHESWSPKRFAPYLLYIEEETFTAI